MAALVSGLRENYGMEMCIWMNTDMGYWLLGLLDRGVLYLFFSLFLLPNVYSIINRKRPLLHLLSIFLGFVPEQRNQQI